MSLVHFNKLGNLFGNINVYTRSIKHLGKYFLNFQHIFINVST